MCSLSTPLVFGVFAYTSNYLVCLEHIKYKRRVRVPYILWVVCNKTSVSTVEARKLGHLPNEGTS